MKTDMKHYFAPETALTVMQLTASILLGSGGGTSSLPNLDDNNIKPGDRNDI